MSRFEHPKGPEHGYLYSTPEEALAAEDDPGIVFSEAQAGAFHAMARDQWRNPEHVAFIEHCRRLAESSVEFMIEVAPGIFTVDHHLARRAGMHVVKDVDPAES